jgi:hypothetical protein
LEVGKPLYFSSFAVLFSSQQDFLAAVLPEQQALFSSLAFAVGFDSQQLMVHSGQPPWDGSQQSVFAVDVSGAALWQHHGVCKTPVNVRPAIVTATATNTPAHTFRSIVHLDFEEKAPIKGQQPNAVGE